MPLVAPVAPIPDPFEERKDIRNSSSNIRRARGQRGRVGAGEPQHELAMQHRVHGTRTVLYAYGTLYFLGSPRMERETADAARPARL